MPVFASIPTAAIAMPYRPANEYAPRIAIAIKMIGKVVDRMPQPMPAMMFVALPVTDCRDTSVTGPVLIPVKCSVTRPIAIPQAKPIRLAQKTPMAVYSLPLYVHASGSRLVIRKNAPTSMITAAISSPRVKPLLGLPPSCTLTNCAPIIEAMMPMAARNNGSKTAPNPLKTSYSSI